jgi:DNA polymerase-1
MKLLLVDGHYYVYRSFFAIRDLSNSRGEPTNAIYGFVKTLRRMVKDLNPELGAVVWDEGLPARRTDLQPAYKQQRAEMPVEMRPQLGFIQEMAPLLGFRSVSLPDTEADDLMASYACAAVRQKMEVILATNDKDLFQLVDENVKIYTTNKADLISPKDTYALLDVACVQKKWGVPPERIGDVIALIGDTVDNIPGVTGLGPKNAAHLLKRHGTLDAILADLNAVENARIREKLVAARERILQNREMVKLDTDLPLPERLEGLRIEPRYEELLAAVEKCEFKSLLEEIRTEAAARKAKGGGQQGELF